MPSLSRILLLLLFVSSFLGMFEWMAFRLLKRKFEFHANWDQWSRYWLVLIGLIWLAFLVNAFMWPTWRVTHPRLLSFLSVLFFVVFIPKLVMSCFQLVDDIRYLLQWSVAKTGAVDRPIPRSSFITTLGLGAAGVTFASFLYGVIWGKYAYRIERLHVAIPNLPVAFDGLKVVQISDAHLGSFSDTPQPVLDALEKINALNPDVILFTGDLVNTDASEAEKWIGPFSELSAPMGKYSVMGNHDYADYGPFTEEERIASRRRLYEIHREMGFNLLMNEHVHFERDGKQLVLLGVENWGKGFRMSGDLTKAMAGSNCEQLPTILMSHDPTHWAEKVKDGGAPVELTLSGHTHGMQFGIEIPWLGIQWSPSKWKYEHWAGLYQSNGQQLYVNRGFGVLGFHGRVGMPPEITLMELKSA